jgi:hypothetical protein
LSCENDEGSFPQTAGPIATDGRGAARFTAEAPWSGVAGRSQSATGETLTRRHQRAERYPAHRDERAGEGNDPFDRWVDRQLDKLYGPVVDEPMPPRLRALLEGAGRGADEGADSGGEAGDSVEASGGEGQG